MKFFCDSCSTKYSISDEKVRGKILKVRCKNCGHVITVREQRLPTESSDEGSKPRGGKPPRPPAPPSSPRFDPSDVEWHYAINGQSFGPFELEELRDQYRTGELGDETYVWTESFSNWKPVAEVEWFQEALQASQQKSPRNKTVGVSGALEAIKPEDVEKYQSEKEQEKASNTQRQRAVDGDRQAAQQERLHALRARLKGDEKQDNEISQANEISDEFDGGAATVVGSSAEDVAGHDRDRAPAADESTTDAGEANDLFSGFDEASETEKADVDETEDSGRIPFSPKAPELESDSKKRRDTGAQESVTGSLLIQLNEIQKEGRGGRVLLIAAAVLLVAGVTGAGLYIHSQNKEDARAVAEKARMQEDDDDEEVTIKTYSDDEQKKILTLGSQTVSEEDKDEASDEEAEADDEKADGAEKEPEKLAKADTKKKPAGLRLRGGSLAESDSSADKAFEGATKSKNTDDGFRKGIDEGSTMGAALDSPISEGSSFESMGGIKSDRSNPIYNPTDSVKKNEGSGGPRLTSDQISEGFRNVRRSIAICRERHGRRGGPLEVRKIYLTLDIRPTGRVKGYELEPSKVQNTVFDRCLSSHKGRWSFPSFGGTSTQKVRAPIVLD